jgi:hypothetical protein
MIFVVLCDHFFNIIVFAIKKMNEIKYHMTQIHPSVVSLFFALIAFFVIINK